jgi:glycosyltransferase involved in cell wall biosynthesis
MPFTKFALRKADRVIAVSEYIRKLTIRIGAEPKKTRKVYLGVDVERFKPIKRMHKRQTIGTLGRIVKEKNVEDIILAFKQISKHRDVKLLIGGDGPNINSLKRMAESMQLRDIHFLGRIKDPSDFYKRCDVFVLASTREGLSTSLQEAMASGCVPVAVRGCGCPELIRDEVNGFMYVPRNVKQLTLRIESALENPKMGLMARRTILDSFNAETNSLKYLDVYFELG